MDSTFLYTASEFDSKAPAHWYINFILFLLCALAPLRETTKDLARKDAEAQSLLLLQAVHNPPDAILHQCRTKIEQ